FNLIPGAITQASRIIWLSPEENQALDTLIEEGLSRGKIWCSTSPWECCGAYIYRQGGSCGSQQ
ncbi:uncharacterized protein VP01_14928g1, partial [Puccinia sorghi]